LHVLFFYKLHAQVFPPKLRCVSVVSNTSTVLLWEPPQAITGTFTEYQVWSSVTQLGPFSLVGSAKLQTQTSFTHAAVSAVSQSQYYFMLTVTNGNISSVASDTLRSMFLNLSNPGNGIISLNWNSVYKIPSSTPSFSVSRQTSNNLWTLVYNGSKLNFRDTIEQCKVFFNYKVELSSSSSCISQSNIKGDTCRNLQPPTILDIDSVSVNHGQAVIGWSKSIAKDVNRYVIFQSNSGILTPLDTVYGRNNTLYIYTKSKANNFSEGFCVSAIDSCGNYSIPSLTHNSIFLKTPKYDSCSKTVDLIWTPYNNLRKGILHYEIFTSINGSPYLSIGTSTTTNFTYKQTNHTGIFCYFVKCVNLDRTISVSSNSVCLTAKTILAPSFVYLNSVNVMPSNKNIEITFTIDPKYSYRGCIIYRSSDGVTFIQKSIVPFSSNITLSYIDNDITDIRKPYFYKVQILDNCGNLNVESNVSKNLILKVDNDDNNSFQNKLIWNNYIGWSGGVSTYNVYRGVNGVFDTIPIVNAPATVNSYIDDIQDFSLEEGKFIYYIEAIEGATNIYGFKNKAVSNIANAYIEGQIFIPNALAPSGENNIWKPILQYINKTDYRAQIFNRWGEVVFETKNYFEGWTGENASDGVYIYLVEFKNSRGEFIQKKGNLTIIK